MIWHIYFGSREFARERGDPLLGTVEAETKEDAERIAISRGLGGTAGVWATLTNLLPGERIDFWSDQARPMTGPRVWTCNLWGVEAQYVAETRAQARMQHCRAGVAAGYGTMREALLVCRVRLATDRERLLADFDWKPF
jgi:hypothetical protein